MQCPHCDHPDYILFGKNRGTQCDRCKACRRIFQTPSRGKDLALNEQAQKLYLKGLGLKVISRIGRAHYQRSFSLACLGCWAVNSYSIMSEACSFIEIDALCSFIAKKSHCWIWISIDTTFGKVLGFIWGRRSIQTTRGLFKQLKSLPTMGWGTDCLETYEHLMLTVLHHPD